MNDYFYHLTHLPSLPTEYHDMATQASYLRPGEHYIKAMVTYSPCVEFEHCPLYKHLCQDFKKVSSAFYRNDPKTVYDWHTDDSYNQPRDCAINILLSQNLGAVTLFKGERVNDRNFKIEICDYKPFGLTLFNNQRQHSIVNPSDSYRYILGISLWGKPFNEAKEYFRDLKLDSYY